MGKDFPFRFAAVFGWRVPAYMRVKVRRRRRIWSGRDIESFHHKHLCKGDAILLDSVVQKIPVYLTAYASYSLQSLSDIPAEQQGTCHRRLLSLFLSSLIHTFYIPYQGVELVFISKYAHTHPIRKGYSVSTYSVCLGVLGIGGFFAAVSLLVCSFSRLFFFTGDDLT